MSAETGSRYGIGFLASLLIASTMVATAESSDKVGPAVYAALESQQRVRVMVYLSIPATNLQKLDTLRLRVADAQDAVIDALGPSGLHVRRRMEMVPALAGTVDATALAQLEARDDVLRVDLDEGGSGNLAQAVPLTKTNLVQQLGLTGQGVTVAVLDSGIDTNHPDLMDNIEGEACFCSGGTGCCPAGGSTQFGAGAAEDDHGHGSNVTGIVTSNGIVAPVGTAPDAGIVAIKVLDSNNSFCCSSDIVAGLDWIIANRPDVDLVNMSLGTFTSFSGDCDTATSWTLSLAAAIDTLHANGVASFVSTGNAGSLTQMEAPACVANSISVGAVWDANVGPQNVFCLETTTAADKITCFTNRNDQTDLLAPGAPITSCYNTGGTSTFYGTSQASPHAAGCAADLVQGFPAMTPTELELVLESNGVMIFDAATGNTYPRVNCFSALNVLACEDADADTHPVSDLCPTADTEDCDDTDPDRFPGNPEVCDGLDNDCDGVTPPGELGAPGALGLEITASLVSWLPEPSADSYDVIRGDLGALRGTGGDFAAATTICVADDTVATTASSGGAPPDGVGWWFLIRGGNCSGNGTYDSGGVGQSGLRDAEIQASGASCP